VTNLYLNEAYKCDVYAEFLTRFFLRLVIFSAFGVVRDQCRVGHRATKLSKQHQRP